MDHRKLEGLARDLLRDIWHDRDRLVPNNADNPFSILDARVAATHLGYEYVEEYELRNFGRENGRGEIAGTLDRQSRRISVAQKFKPEWRRFTGGHEIGHAVLHPGCVLHRDRPVPGIKAERLPRELVEREADYFSACFFVPGRLLESEFESRFGPAPLKLDDTSAFWLGRTQARTLLEGSLRDFAFSVAGAISYETRYFESLHAVFGVSVSTMAYRLLETQLVES